MAFFVSVSNSRRDPGPLGDGRRHRSRGDSSLLRESCRPLRVAECMRGSLLALMAFASYLHETQSPLTVVPADSNLLGGIPQRILDPHERGPLWAILDVRNLGPYSVPCWVRIIPVRLALLKACSLPLVPDPCPLSLILLRHIFLSR